MEETGAVGKYARDSFIVGFRNEHCQLICRERKGKSLYLLSAF